MPAMLADGAPFPGRAEIIACTLVVILVTLIGQGVTLLPLVRRLGLSDADPTEVEVRRAREAMLSAGIARLDAFCSEESCPIAVYRLRDAMSDQLASLQAEDALARAQALAAAGGRGRRSPRRLCRRRPTRSSRCATTERSTTGSIRSCSSISIERTPTCGRGRAALLLLLPH